MLTITAKAQEKIQSYYQADESLKGKSLRILLKPSGCAGFEYAFGFDDKRGEDQVFKQDLGFEVLVDNNSMQFLADATIDYSDNPMDSGFKIKNPKEKSSCGCGKSKQF